MTIYDNFEWDDAKARSNLSRHKVSFPLATHVFEGDCLTFEDNREDYGETRCITYGQVEARVLAVVWTPRNDRIRLISARKATKDEQEIYFEKLYG